MKTLLRTSLLVVCLMLAYTNVANGLQYQTDWSEMEKTFEDCYLNYTHENASPRTTDRFINLIDKIEHHITSTYSLSDLAAVLLSRFRRDGVVITQYYSSRDDYFKKRQDAIFSLIPDVDTGKAKDINDVIDEVFTAEDNCTMHFMLSHTTITTKKMNPTKRAKRSNIFRRALDAIESEVGLLGQAGPAGPNIESIEELGAIYNAFGTTFGGTILAGIAASKSTGADRLFKTKDGKMSGERVVGTTIGGYLGIAVLNFNPNSQVSNYFGPSGSWKSVKCTKHYMLNMNQTYYMPYNTESLLIGAIDGYLLGTSISNLEKQYYHLATVLRTYFGSEDIYSMNITACQRWSKYGQDKKKNMPDQVETMAQYFSTHFSTSQGSMDKARNTILNYFDNSVVLDQQNKSRSCPDSSGHSQNYICSTDAEVIVVMDPVANMSHNEYAAQILSGINTNGSTIGVYTNTKNKDNNLNALAAIGSTTKIDAVCAAENFSPRNIDLLSLSDTIYAVNSLFASRNKDNLEKAYKPAQIAVIMQSSPVKNETAVYSALKNLKNFQPGVDVLIMGNFNLPKMPVRNLFPFSSGPLDEIHNRICQLPGNLLYNYCVSTNSDKEKEMKFNGRISPNHIRYLTVDPQFFESSTNVKITFALNNKYSADQVVLKVYQDRGPYVSTSSKSKIQLDKSNTEASFSIDNPCANFDQGNCTGISFAVVGVRCDAPNGGCCRDKDHCSMPDQIQYTVTHEGFYCGNALKMLSSPMTLLFSFFIILLANKFHL